MGNLYDSGETSIDNLNFQLDYLNRIRGDLALLTGFAVKNTHIIREFDGGEHFDTDLICAFYLNKEIRDRSSRFRESVFSKVTSMHQEQFC